jgi:hypothetical protein
MSLRGAGRIGLVAILVPVLIGAASAEAKKKHKKPKSPPVTVVSASKSTSADNQQVTVTASCPSGLISVGGGFLSPPLLVAGAPTDLNVVYESRRAGDSAWQVSAVREDSDANGPDLGIVASVDCRTAKLAAKKPAGKKATVANKMKKKKQKTLRITEVSASGASAPTSGAQAEATASCPPGTQALGGGFSSSPAPDLSAHASFPYFWADYRTSPTSWRAAYSNIGTIARTVTTYADCAAGLNISETNGSATLPASGTTVSGATALTPPCPTGKALLGGGFNDTPASMTSALALLKGSSADNGSWGVAALNGAAVGGTLGSFGYCA